MRVRANAKVNLFLRVMDRRPDGFHAIESVFHSIDLADELIVESLDGPSITVSGIDLTDDTVTRSALALRSASGSERGAAIQVSKNIPIGAGLAGGSADAAATLIALDRLWETGFDTDKLSDLAASIGSDVPFCLVGGPARVTGRGESVERLQDVSALSLVLGVTEKGLSTSDVYRRFDEVGASPYLDSAGMIAALAADDPVAVGAHLHNDLESAAFDLRPELSGLKERVVNAGALGAAMSGSGPTMFGVCENETQAHDVAGKLEGVFNRVLVTTTRPVGVEIVIQTDA